MYRCRYAVRRAFAISSCWAVVVGYRSVRYRRGRNGNRKGHRLCIRDLALDQQPAFLCAVGRVAERLQQQVGVLNRLQVPLHLCGQLPGVPLSVLLQLLLLLDQPALGFLELRRQELARALRLVVSIGEILFDIQRGKPLRDLSRCFRVCAHIAHTKRLRLLADDADVDVEPHPGNDILHDSLFPLAFV